MAPGDSGLSSDAEEDEEIEEGHEEDEETKKGPKEWLVDGKRWHLEHRCGRQTGERLLLLDEIVRKNAPVFGPIWSQKCYVSYLVGESIWLSIITKKSLLEARFSVRPGAMDIESLSRTLGV